MIALGDYVLLPRCFPEFPEPGHRALVWDRDGDYWVLDLTAGEKGEAVTWEEDLMMWPLEDADLLVKLPKDHEHCVTKGKCWQDKYPCPAFNL